MSYELGGEVVSGLQMLGFSGLGLIGFVSIAFLKEQRQLEEQQGPKKRTYVWENIGDLGHTIGIATKYIANKIKVQHLFLIGPNGERIYYHFLPQLGYGRLIDREHKTERVPPEQAVNKMLLEAYGLQNQH